MHTSSRNFKIFDKSCIMGKSINHLLSKDFTNNFRKISLLPLGVNA